MCRNNGSQMTILPSAAWWIFKKIQANINSADQIQFKSRFFSHFWGQIDSCFYFDFMLHCKKNLEPFFCAKKQHFIVATLHSYQGCVMYPALQLLRSNNTLLQMSGSKFNHEKMLPLIWWCSKSFHLFFPFIMLTFHIVLNEPEGQTCKENSSTTCKKHFFFFLMKVLKFWFFTRVVIGDKSCHYLKLV